MFYLIDKPVGESSFNIIRSLRKKLWTRKIWHAGTLDPLASGCLLIATDHSTKLLSVFTEVEKRYYFECSIDATTPSLDLWTSKIEHDINAMEMRTKEELKDFLEEMSEQVPPSYSALHIDWERAYILARKGKDFKIPTRKIQISDVEIVHFAPPMFSIRLTISSGWYIRTIADDIWKFFWLPGWYITFLRRESLISDGKIICHIRDAQDLETFDANKTLDVQNLFPLVEKIDAPDEITEKIGHGIVPYGFLSEKQLRVWQNIFIYKNNCLFSLLRFGEDGLQIIKNNL